MTAGRIFTWHVHSSPSLLFMNNRDGTFREEALLRGVGLMMTAPNKRAMALVRDYDLDGALDIFKTHFADDPNILYRNTGKGDFDDVTVASGYLGVETRYVSWGAGMFDFDNNGDPICSLCRECLSGAWKSRCRPILRLREYVSQSGKGHSKKMIEQGGQRWGAPHCSRGCAFGDFVTTETSNLIVNLNEAPSLLRNDATRKTDGTMNCRDAIESLAIGVAYGILGQLGERKRSQSQGELFTVNDLRLHFGVQQNRYTEVRWTYWKNRTYPIYR